MRETPDTKDALRKVRVAARIGVATVAMALLSAAVAVAEEAPAPSRAEYVAKLEGICKPRALATKRAVRGMRADLRAERLAIAAAKFARASRLFATTVREISPLPRPLADRATLARWFRYLDQEESNLRRIVAVLRANHPVAFQHASARFVKSGERADNVVLAYGFNYCYFKLSRFE
jgi:hypothetical protein